MKIEITSEKDDAGRTVYAWNIYNAAGLHLAGGYCATRADAQNDAQSWINGQS